MAVKSLGNMMGLTRNLSPLTPNASNACSSYEVTKNKNLTLSRKTLATSKPDISILISKNKKAVGENVPKLIYDNETLEILHANEAAATVFGFSVTQLLNSKISDICLDDFSELIDNEKVQFPIDKPMPLDLIKRITEFRVEENLKKVKK
ncbi:MAG: hypothetical protein EOP00_31580 [Pedobacter sp.]|nr:MAG: hypothetical protein EOP00_31580 [Pedobacter sp.]